MNFVCVTEIVVIKLIKVLDTKARFVENNFRFLYFLGINNDEIAVSPLVLSEP